VWVGKHRHEAARRAAKQGTDIVILDDGMQYRKLARDVEIVIVDGQDLLAGGRLVPAGRLRDFPSRLGKADFIIVNHAEEELPLSAYQQQLSPFTHAPAATVRTRPVLKSGESIAGRRVGVFCALGRPERFIAAIRAMPCDIVAAFAAPDHTAISEDALRNFTEQCLKKGAESLVCSAKDAVKLPQGLPLALPLAVMDAEMEILQGHEAWNAMLARIKEKRKFI
jgi:tetraacyldisaccharide 4'-kinase